MKLYEVVFELPGKTLKAPGVSETELRREKTYYAAESAVEVWEEAHRLFMGDQERTFISLTEVLPAVSVLRAESEE